MGEVADALHRAYTQQGGDGAPLHLIHRDIKPSNIRLTPHGKIKVLDFGIARAAFQGREAKTSGLFYGTPSYTAPERFEQNDVHERDVYSLAVVLFELVLGAKFGRTSADSVKHALHLAKNLQRLHQAGIPGDIIALLERSLAFEPSARPSEAAMSSGETGAARARIRITAPSTAALSTRMAPRVAPSTRRSSAPTSCPLGVYQ